jgi:hypothetical protein
LIPFAWLVYLGMLAVAAILVAAILAVLGLGPDDHDGPWSFGAVLLVGLSMAPQFPAEQPMSAGCGGPWAATIARDGAAPESVDFSGGVRRGASATSKEHR